MSLCTKSETRGYMYCDFRFPAGRFDFHTMQWRELAGRAQRKSEKGRLSEVEILGEKRHGTFEIRRFQELPKVFRAKG